MAFRVTDLIVDTLIAHSVDRAFRVAAKVFLRCLTLRTNAMGSMSTSLAAVADAKLTG
jgi:acetolactate synthase-1/2/3 large subunit